MYTKSRDYSGNTELAFQRQCIMEQKEILI